jgi:tetratricopeptide (TPR) repeat protein
MGEDSVSRVPSAKTVNITNPIIVAIIGLIATIAAAIIGVSGGRGQESTKTIELLAEKFDSVDKKMSYEQALQVIYEDSQKMEKENQNLSDDNIMLKDENNILQEQISTVTDETNKQLLESVKSFAKSGDYAKALTLLKSVTNKTPEMEVLISDYSQEYETQIISQINVLYGEEKYDEALTKINDSLKIFPNSNILSDKQKEIENSFPKPLSEIFLIDSGGNYEFIKSGVFTDSFGNVYDGTYHFVASYNAFAIYNLDKKYSKFSASIVAGTDTGSGASMTLAVYADDKLLYVQKEYNKRTGKIDFNIDVSGITKLKIETSNQGEYYHGDIFFVNAILSR